MADFILERCIWEDNDAVFKVLKELEFWNSVPSKNIFQKCEKWKKLSPADPHCKKCYSKSFKKKENDTVWKYKSTQRDEETRNGTIYVNT